ncbi:thioredoxin reductase 1, cytoplasmic-like [Gordionus sp. m RMFG-2023]|uniref:thioredoxin reductase 1, cytoplasmic-like n=1 Tax=Gordionus sp. m RMFG-2023 TaxID=3053472 RepID=UPI0031FC61A2
MSHSLSPHDLILQYIKDNRVMIFSKSYCPYCKTVKDYFANKNIPFKALELNEIANGSEIQNDLHSLTRQRTVPNVFIGGVHVGGSDSVMKLANEGKLSQLLAQSSQDKIEEMKEAPDFDYDLIVLGGGSGGLASSKEAAKYGIKVAVFDYIVPTPLGTTWGLGGTCVNVGCIPKKLMHQTSLLKEEIVRSSDAMGYSFPNFSTNEDDQHCHHNNNDDHNIPQLMDLEESSKTLHSNGELSSQMIHRLTYANHDQNISKIDWNKMVQAIQNYVQGLNFKYKSALRSSKVTYFNAYAKFVDDHTIEAKDKKGKITRLTSANFIIATGLRPSYLEIPGAKEYCITSDDLFSLPYPPGKTLCVGASYISLECAGFLHGIGYPVTIMVRSILLRGFDRGMADVIGGHMEREGINFIKQAIPTKIVKLKEGNPGLYKVHYVKDDGTEGYEMFNTILLAIGRIAKTQDLNLHSIGVKINPKTRKILTSSSDQSSVPHIYSIGDNTEGRPELTPVAVQAGILLAKRLFAPSNFKTLCEYETVPTTVFTPIEYGACGLSQEEATEKFGLHDVEVYIKKFRPLEWDISKIEKNHIALYKIIAIKSLQNKVVGFHFCGPDAGEVTQGFGVAIKTGKGTLADFKRIIEMNVPESQIYLNAPV